MFTHLLEAATVVGLPLFGLARSFAFRWGSALAL
jgi:hypothetical protein